MNLSVDSDGKRVAAMCVGVGEERKREAGREGRTTRRVYHQVRVRRERRAEGTVWSGVRETAKTALLWAV